MILKIRNIFIFLLIFALFLGGTVEISEGSKIIGLFILVVALLGISRIKLNKPAKIMKITHSYFFMGLGIVISDIIYNLATSGKLGTLDIMTFLFGSSLVALSLDNMQLRRMGIFIAHMSATFLVLFLIFFSFFNILNINFTHYFDHYFVLVPVVFILHILGIPVEVIGIETVRMSGIEDMSVVIGGPCSGLYSMFLLIGIIVGYTKLERFESRNIHITLIITIIVAYVSNLIRVTVVYITGYYFGSETLMFVHTHLGWIVFTVVAGILIIILNKTTSQQD